MWVDLAELTEIPNCVLGGDYDESSRRSHLTELSTKEVPNLLSQISLDSETSTLAQNRLTSLVVTARHALQEVEARF